MLQQPKQLQRKYGTVEKLLSSFWSLTNYLARNWNGKARSFRMIWDLDFIVIFIPNHEGNKENVVSVTNYRVLF